MLDDADFQRYAAFGLLAGLHLPAEKLPIAIEFLLEKAATERQLKATYQDVNGQGELLKELLRAVVRTHFPSLLPRALTPQRAVSRTSKSLSVPHAYIVDMPLFAVLSPDLAMQIELRTNKGGPKQEKRPSIRCTVTNVNGDSAGVATMQACKGEQGVYDVKVEIPTSAAPPRFYLVSCYLDNECLAETVVFSSYSAAIQSGALPAPLQFKTLEALHVFLLGPERKAVRDAFVVCNSPPLSS